MGNTTLRVSRATVFALSLASGALLEGAVAAAQQAEASAESGGAIEEIVVTAQKREEKLQDVPIAISVVNEAQLQTQHIYTIADLARTTPALEMIQSFGGPGGGGQIRGIGTQSFTRSAEGAVGIVVDGVPQGNVNISNMFDMQRVEVLRGPQGTLFGLTSSAGVINMVTNAPDPNGFQARAHLDYSDNGSVGSKFGQQTLRGVVNIPLSDASALRISANADRVDGVERNNFTNEDDVSKDYGIRARYRWQGDNLDVNLIADFDHRTQNYSDPRFTYAVVAPGTPLDADLAACGITASFANNARCGSQANNSKNRNYGLSAQFDWQLNDLTLTSITAYRKNDLGPLDFDAQGVATAFPQIFVVDSVSDGRLVSQEFRIASPAANKLEYVAGLFYSDAKATSGYENVGPTGLGGLNIGFFPAPGAPFVPFFQDGSSTETSNKAVAVFGQATYHINDQLGLIFGARYTHQKITDHSSSNPYIPGTPVTDGDTSEDNVSGRLGLTYKFNADVSSYVTVTRGYKGPQVVLPNLGLPLQVINAEIPTAYEIGVKATTLAGRLGIDANVFYTDVKDYQGQRCSINPVGALSCTGESIPSVTSKGFEIDFFGQPVEGLRLNAGYIYNIAEYPDGWTGYNPDDLRPPPQPPVPGDLTGQTDLGGQQIVGVPKNKFTFAADYSWPMGGMEGFVGADTVYKSELRLGPTADDRFVYPSHFTTGVRLGVRGAEEKWSLTLFARNISDEHEPVVIFGGPAFVPPGAVPFLPNGFVQGVSGWQSQESLRQVGLSFDMKF